MSKHLLEGIESSMFSLTDIDGSTTKSMYGRLLDSLLPAKITQQYPDRDWERVWHRLNHGVLSPLSKEHLYLILHERVFTRERAYFLNYHNIDSPSCNLCNDNSPATILHRYCECSAVLDAWNRLRDLLETLDSSTIMETDHSLINLYYDEPLCGNSILWLI